MLEVQVMIIMQEVAVAQMVGMVELEVEDGKVQVAI
jgi:hypothetical protein